MSYLQAMWLVLKRECLLRYRKRHELINPLLFFILVTTLFPLATTPDSKILILLGPGVIWVAALLATLLSLNKIFQDDYVDGSLEQMLLSRYPLAVTVFAKIVAHWLIFMLPLILITPLIALMFHLSAQVTLVLLITLLIGTPILILLGSIAAALTVGLRNSGLLLALLILPIYVPILIFGSGAVIAVENHLAFAGQLLLLAALLVLAITLAPVTVAFALRVGVNYQ